MAKRSASKIRFTATLLRPAVSNGKHVSEGWIFLTLPKQASAKLPSRSRVSVKGTVNGAAFTATLEPDGNGGHWLKVDRKLRAEAGADVGETVALEITTLCPDP